MQLNFSLPRTKFVIAFSSDDFSTLKLSFVIGCSWRAIPHDFPKWQNVHYHNGIWTVPNKNGESVLDRILRRLVEAQWEQEYRNVQTTMIIADLNSIPNADSAEEKGYEAGKTFRYQATHRR